MNEYLMNFSVKFHISANLVSSPKNDLPTLRSSALVEIKDTNESLINLQKVYSLFMEGNYEKCLFIVRSLTCDCKIWCLNIVWDIFEVSKSLRWNPCEFNRRKIKKWVSCSLFNLFSVLEKQYKSHLIHFCYLTFVSVSLLSVFALQNRFLCP